MPASDPELIDELLKDGASPELLFGNDGLLQQLTEDRPQ
jgi:hypothetical protein